MLTKSIAHDFPELITVSSIGKSYQGRDITLIELDAREPVVAEELAQKSSKNGVSLAQTELKQQVKKELEEHYYEKPSILLTGQHHAREHITVNTVMYSLLNLLHGGYVHGDPQMRALLKQNRYLMIPSVNVDGVHWIEEEYKRTGDLPLKRKNMHF